MYFIFIKLICVKAGGDVYCWEDSMVNSHDENSGRPCIIQGFAVEKAIRGLRITAVAVGLEHCVALTGKNFISCTGTF